MAARLDGGFPQGTPARSPMAYTVHDTPEVAARIEADLGRVLAVVRRSDPGLRSLVLTGGFARGEGAMLDGAPQNDYDFVAFRGLRRPAVPYAAMAAALEDELGLHIDLAPVASVRIPFLAPSIFWYETGQRGRVLWGEDLLGRIRTRSPRDLGKGEALRLLVNRAAGLLLVTPDPDEHTQRIQASKGLLAALDAHLLAAGRFAPSQTERWQVLARLRANRGAPAAVVAEAAWFDWAFRFKVDPASAPPRGAAEAWQAARRAILAAVPVALRHAGLADLEAYERRDGPIDRAVYVRRSAKVPGARRWASHPTGRVRVATLKLLEDSADGRVRSQDARHRLAGVAHSTDEPLSLLDTLRRATLQ